jgi:ParB-like chromosome segregation protein Spo0J
VNGWPLNGTTIRIKPPASYPESANLRKRKESIEKHGLLTPLLITKDRIVLSGHSRLRALRLLGEKYPTLFQQANVTVFRGTELEAEKVLIESNRQRVKTPEQKTREFTELKRIEAALADARKLAELKKGKKSPVKLKSTDRGQARDKAAEAVNMGWQKPKNWKK